MHYDQVSSGHLERQCIISQLYYRDFAEIPGDVKLYFSYLFSFRYLIKKLDRKRLGSVLNIAPRILNFGARWFSFRGTTR